jgi:hypothetical protein
MSWITDSARWLIQYASRYPWAPVLAAFVLALTLWNLPIVASGSEVDISLIDVLNYAHEHHLQFGPEIASTYGPLGWLYFPYFSQNSGMLQLIAQFFLSITALVGCCFVAWRLTLLWRCVLLIVFTWAASNMSYRADLLVDVSLLCWSLLCLLETGRRLLAALTVFGIFAACASLAKISFLFIAATSVAYVSVDLLLRRKRRLAISFLPGSLIAFLVGWVACGQNLAHLGSFFTHAVSTVQSYNQALGLEGLPALRLIAFLLTIALLCLIGVRCMIAFRDDPHPPLRQALLFLWLFLFVLASWKHGFIRLDGFHASLFLGLALVFALSTETLIQAPTPVARWSRALMILCALISAILLQTFFFSALPQSLVQPFREFKSHVACLFHPFECLRELRRFRADIKEEYQLPQCPRLIGRSSVDVFGQYQAYAIDNDLNYTPRPVFQSYNACNRALMALNEHFYLSSSAPQFVLFDIKSMDEKFPPLEDARLLRHLLINYQPVAQEKRFILLRAKSSEPCRLGLVSEDHIQFGQQIDLRKYGESPLWVEIELTPSFRGWLRQSFYAAPIIRLAAWSDPGKTLIIKRRAPSSMLSAGFVASPLLLTTRDMQLLSAGKSSHPAAYSVEADPGQRQLWRNDIRVRIFRIENPLAEDRKS